MLGIKEPICVLIFLNSKHSAKPFFHERVQLLHTTQKYKNDTTVEYKTKATCNTAVLLNGYMYKQKGTVYYVLGCYGIPDGVRGSTLTVKFMK